MSNEQHRGDARTTADGRVPGRIGGQRLELPRFQFAPPSLGAAAPERPAAGTAAPAPALAPSFGQGLRPAPRVARHRPEPVQPQVQRQPAHAPLANPWANQTSVPRPVAVAMPAPAPVAAPVRTVTPAASAMANATARATVSWERIEQPAQRGLLQRITPVHMGLMLVLVLVMTVVTAGPSSMSVKPSRLPAVASGGGVGDSLMQPRAVGATAAAARAAGADTAKARQVGAKTGARRSMGARFLRIGTARVSRTVRAGGIPSPAAAANLAVAGGGRVDLGSTADVQMRGIPSPAAAQQLGPQTLPMEAGDGVTLPRTTLERDSHATDAHYGADTLPMEEAVQLPAMTPGEAADQARSAATQATVSGGGTAGVPAASGGLIVAI